MCLSVCVSMSESEREADRKVADEQKQRKMQKEFGAQCEKQRSMNEI